MDARQQGGKSQVLNQRLSEPSADSFAAKLAAMNQASVTNGLQIRFVSHTFQN